MDFYAEISNFPYLPKTIPSRSVASSPLKGTPCRKFSSKRKAVAKAKRKELLDLNKIKDQLLSIIAHDVKSPMTDLYNLLFILRHNLNAIQKDELKKNLAVVESSTSNLLNFLNNILNWTISQSSGIRVKLSSFSLNELRVLKSLRFLESQQYLLFKIQS